MMLLIDNYDSFTYNLAQYFGELGQEVEVIRNDAIDLEGIKAKNPERIVVSPGPCTPNEAGISVPLIKEFWANCRFLACASGIKALLPRSVATSFARSV